MQNYSQNSNNYLENMLGETANIRCAHHPYFQIFIILDKLPYYSYEKDKKDKKDRKIIKNWETFTCRNAKKYAALSNDNIDKFFHMPNKTLIYVVHIPDNDALRTKDEYLQYYQNLKFRMQLSKHEYKSLFGSSVTFNNYKTFIEEVIHTILAL